MDFIITMPGLATILINGFFAFWVVRFAHKVTEDPEYEKKMFKKWDEKKLK